MTQFDGPNSQLNQNLTERKTQLALESVQQLKNTADYMVVIPSLELIKNELGKIFTTEEIERVYNDFMTTGHPFRFCHMLLTPYYIAFSKTEDLKDFLAPPNQWPAVLPIEVILNAIQVSCVNSQSENFH